MALSIGVKAGSKIKVKSVRDHIVEVLNVPSHDRLVISVDGVQFEVTDKQRVEILPRVFVFCGSKDSRGVESYTRLAFEAPKIVRIERVPQ